jgi:hypothetical protein
MLRFCLVGALALPVVGAAPLVRQIDHVMFVGGADVATLIPILRDTFQLPVVFDGPSQTPPTPGTGIGFGNVTLEVVPLNEESGQPRRVAALGSLALQAETFAAAPDELRARQIDHFPPASESTWRTIGLRGFGRGVFFIQYERDMDAGRAQFARLLEDRSGGPLGIVRVKEIAVGHPDVASVRPLWTRLLGPPSAADGNVWPIGNGPAIRLVARDSELRGRVLVTVRDTTRAAASLRTLAIGFDRAPDGLRIQAQSLAGLQVTLTQTP